MPTARESSERSWLANLAIAKHEFDTKGYITINNAWKSSTFNGRVSGRTNLEPWQKEMLVDFGFPTRAENKLMRAASKNATKERNIVIVTDDAAKKGIHMAPSKIKHTCNAYTKKLCEFSREDVRIFRCREDYADDTMVQLRLHLLPRPTTNCSLWRWYRPKIPVETLCPPSLLPPYLQTMTMDCRAVMLSWRMPSSIWMPSSKTTSSSTLCPLSLMPTMSSSMRMSSSRRGSIPLHRTSIYYYT